MELNTSGIQPMSHIPSTLSIWQTTPIAIFSLTEPINSTTTHLSITIYGMMTNCTTNTIGISTITPMIECNLSLTEIVYQQAPQLSINMFTSKHQAK